jgi:hypothetical protein
MYCMFDWTIYRLFVVTKIWKRDFLQMMILLYVFSKCSVLEHKLRFETWIARNRVNGIYLFHLYYLITLLAYLFSQSSCAKYGLEMWFSPNYHICKWLLGMQRSWNKNAFWDVNNKTLRNWCKFFFFFLFNNTYGLPVPRMGTKCPYQLFYVWLVDLHTICAKYGLVTRHAPNKGIRKYLFDMKRSWIKNAFFDVNNKKCHKWCKFVNSFLFNNPYGHQLTKSSIVCLIGVY